MSFERVRVGIIGAGDISHVYFNAINRSPALELRGVASRRLEQAQEVAARHGTLGMSMEALLADDSIEMVVNLTPCGQHEEVNRRIIAAGKHVYTEKPFALSAAVATELAEDAKRRRVLLGSAPDPFYGAGHQAARHLIDSGAIGKPVFGTSFLGLPGLELYHPNPAAYYQPGGEPAYDISPYFISQWINLLGPVRQVYSSTGAGVSERTIQRGPKAGERFAVTVPTTFNTVFEFDQASVSYVVSLDVAEPTLRPSELYGSEGCLTLPDALFFGGTPELFQPQSGRAAIAIHDRPFANANHTDYAGRQVADYRGVGMVELALAIRGLCQHRTGPELIIHTSEVMEAMVRSGREQRAIALRTTCQRPAPVDAVTDALLIAMTPSPFNPDVRTAAN